MQTLKSLSDTRWSSKAEPGFLLASPMSGRNAETAVL